MRTFSWAIASVATLAFTACSAAIDTTGSGTTTGAAVGTTTGGTTTGGVADYPVPVAPDQYGTAVGNTFPNISLAGGAITNLNTSKTLDCDSSSKVGKCTSASDCCTTDSPNFVPTYSFKDLYNAGKPAPDGQGFRYAFIDISGAWCPHCQDEANTLPKDYVAKWLGEGGIVFSILVQNATETGPATTDTLFNWISYYQINYPMSIDTQSNLVFATGLKAWPGNIIIRLHDMKVIESVLGATDQFYQDFSTALTVCENDSTLPNDCWAGATCQSGVCVNSN